MCRGNAGGEKLFKGDTAALHAIWCAQAHAEDKKHVDEP